MIETVAWLDAEAAADRLSLRVSAFLRRVKAGDLPKPSYALGPRSPRWSAAELDSVLSGGGADSPSLSQIVDDILREGREKRARRAARKR